MDFPFLVTTQTVYAPQEEHLLIVDAFIIVSYGYGSFPQLRLSAFQQNPSDYAHRIHTHNKSGLYHADTSSGLS
jgi:hypothetical protein